MLMKKISLTQIAIELKLMLITLKKKLNILKIVKIIKRNSKTR
jgi:hypothetical protein